MRKITFTPEELTAVYQVILEKSGRDQGTYIRDIEEKTKLEKWKIKKIIKQLKEDTRIYTTALVWEEGGYYGNGFIAANY